jgi:hypothetical protein
MKSFSAVGLIVVVSTMAVFPKSAAADPLIGPPIPPTTSDHFRSWESERPRKASPAAVYLGLAAADMATTEWGLALGGAEQNPLLGHRAVRLTIAGGIGAGLYAWDVREQRLGRDPKRRRTARVVYAVAKIGFIGWNAHQLARARGR